MDRSHSSIFCKINEIERFALQVAILHEHQNYLGDGGSLGGSEKNRGTVQYRSEISTHVNALQTS